MPFSHFLFYKWKIRFAQAFSSSLLTHLLIQQIRCKKSLYAKYCTGLGNVKPYSRATEIWNKLSYCRVREARTRSCMARRRQEGD